MKIGVFNLYWSTFGGGEAQAGGVVDALASGHQVELLGPEDIDLAMARERLGLSLDGVTFRRIASDQYAATLASADYDLFINHTYRSTAPNLSRHGLYFVMFPHPLEDVSTLDQLARSAGKRMASPVRVLGGVMVRKGESLMVGPVALQIRPEVRSVELGVRASEPHTVSVVSVHRGAEVQHVAVEGAARISVPVVDGLAVIAPQFMGEALDPDDALRLTDIWIDGARHAVAPHSLAQRLERPRARDFLATYQRVVALSAYTQLWTKRRWGVESDIVSPPVKLRSPGSKEQLIVSVGRFFGEQSGHSKRQLELVRAFRQLIDGGLTGWRLILIGGCAPADREYAMSVRAEAEGLPVEVRLNAPGAFVDASLAAASIYWHGAGYGSDLEAMPERAEHFGIAPIEAMSAGAVPVVFDAAGPAEVVRPGVDGLVFRTLDELVSHTLRLIGDPVYRDTLAASARQRSVLYNHEHFAANVRSLVERVG
ncbi:MAG: glycosyltransferase family 4 protein [Actinomycetota bacterium]